MTSSAPVVLVTGAARGLGWGIGRAFGLAGWCVCATDVDEAELARCARDLAADGADHHTAPMDVADLAACQDVIDRTAERWGRLDALVHNAIYMPLITFAETSPREWTRQIDVGLNGMFHCARAAWPHLRAQGGHLIGIASGSSVRGYEREIAYCAIKHGVEGFVKALSLEWAAVNVAVNTMSPGAPIKPTRMTWSDYDRADAGQKSAWTDPVRLGRAFVWLASQPPRRFNGYRFDAGPVVDTLDREGPDFVFAPEKVTLYPEDFRERQRWYERHQD